MTQSRTFQVKDVARIAGVSVRTLHHYDSMGLLVPEIRTAAGYRVYTDTDLLRLQQILIGRELGLSLEETRRSLDDPGFDRMAALLDQRERLRERIRQTEAMICAVDAALAAVDGGRKEREMKVEDLFQGCNPAQYDDEARRRWGTSEAFVESAKRTTFALRSMRRSSRTAMFCFTHSGTGIRSSRTHNACAARTMRHGGMIGRLC